MKKYLASFFIVILFLAGCVKKGHTSYKVHTKSQKTLNNPTSGNYVETKDGITLTVKSLSGIESEDLFDVNLVKKGYIPIYIGINNHTNQKIILRKSYLDLNLCEPQEIAKQMHYNTSLYGWGLGVPLFLFYWPAAVGVGVMSYSMSNANQETNERMEDSIYYDVLEVKPYESIYKFMFINKIDFKYNFRVNLFNNGTRNLTSFDVNLVNN